MKSITGKKWKVLTDGDEAENVPLWRALAQFTSDDLDEGLRANAAVINREKKRFLRNYSIALALSAGLGGSFFMCLIVWLSLAHSNSALANVFFPIVFFLFVAALTPHLWRWRYQYGLPRPDAPLDLSHEANEHFDRFLGYLQKEDGPRAYYLSRFGRKRRPLNRRQFYGRLRYFLFSEHDTDRGMVIRYPTALPIPADLYLHRDDVEEMIARSCKPKRQGGPGRPDKYQYLSAALAVFEEFRLKGPDLGDRKTAIQIIRERLHEWFKVNPDKSGGEPNLGRLARDAEEIYEYLKKVASPPAC